MGIKDGLSRQSESQASAHMAMQYATGGVEEQVGVMTEEDSAPCKAKAGNLGLILRAVGAT